MTSRRKAGSLLACAAWMCVLPLVLAVPHGHLQPLGSWKSPLGKVETLDRLPSPREFFDKYAGAGACCHWKSDFEWNKEPDFNFGVPFIVKGLAKKMPAYKKWATDASLAKLYPNVQVKAELAKIEHRTHEEKHTNMKEWLQIYNTTDGYCVSDLPTEMAKDILLPNALSCGGFTKQLDIINFWMSSGGTHSVIHRDDQDNFNCIISGRKRMVMFHPKYRDRIETKPYGWWDVEKWGGAGYGAFSKNIDVLKVDLVKYPGWQTVDWWDADMDEGDCLWIPNLWFHQVNSYERNIAVNIWFWRIRQFEDDAECNTAPPQYKLTDCTWHYEPPDDGQPERTKHTTCSSKDTPKAPRPSTATKVPQEAEGAACKDIPAANVKKLSNGQFSSCSQAKRMCKRQLKVRQLCRKTCGKCGAKIGAADDESDESDGDEEEEEKPGIEDEEAPAQPPIDVGGEKEKAEIEDSEATAQPPIDAEVDEKFINALETIDLVDVSGLDQSYGGGGSNSSEAELRDDSRADDSRVRGRKMMLGGFLLMAFALLLHSVAAVRQKRVQSFAEMGVTLLVVSIFGMLALS